MADISAAEVSEDMRDWVLEAGGNDASVDRRLERAATVLRFPLSRVRSIYHRKARRIDAHEYLAAHRRMEQVRLRQLEAMRQQVACLEAQYGHDRDALTGRLRELAGPYLEVLQKLGIASSRTEGTSKNGEG